MSQLKINLLPRDILLARQLGSKARLINKLSIGLLVILICLTSATLGIRFVQNLDLKKANTNLTSAQNLVESQGIVEAQAALVKQQLDSIESISGQDANRKAIFNLLVALMPADVQISEASVDKESNMTLTLSSPSLSSLQDLFSGLSDPEKNAGLISKVDLQGLSVDRDGAYRFGLRITGKR